jgi:hypothetical protein
MLDLVPDFDRIGVELLDVLLLFDLPICIGFDGTILISDVVEQTIMIRLFSIKIVQSIIVLLINAYDEIIHTIKL